jgi:hypothetical protein
MISWVTIVKGAGLFARLTGYELAMGLANIEVDVRSGNRKNFPQRIDNFLVAFEDRLKIHLALGRFVHGVSPFARDSDSAEPGP